MSFKKTLIGIRGDLKTESFFSHLIPLYVLAYSFFSSRTVVAKIVVSESIYFVLYIYWLNEG